jgi:hypothetical protein
VQYNEKKKVEPILAAVPTQNVHVEAASFMYSSLGHFDLAKSFFFMHYVDKMLGSHGQVHLGEKNLLIQNELLHFKAIFCPEKVLCLENYWIYLVYPEYVR